MELLRLKMHKYDLFFILVACLEMYIIIKIKLNKIDKNFYNKDIPMI